MTARRRPNVALAALLTALTTALAGCGASGNDRAREYFPDMARGLAYKVFAPNAATRTGLTLQAPVRRSVTTQVFHFGPGEGEAARAGRELTNPLPLSAGTIEDGRGLYQTYCPHPPWRRTVRATARWSWRARSRRRPPTRPSVWRRSRPAAFFTSSSIGAR